MSSVPKTKLLVLAMMVGCALNAHALDLVTAFEKAQQHDPSYKAALAEKDANKAQAAQAWTSYLPSAKWTQTRNELDTLGPRKALTFSQPIFDAAKGATVLQGGARSDYADSVFLGKEQELAQRLLKAVNQIILASEAIAANEKRIEAFESQYQGAKRKFELGQGTITDLRDIEVKFQQSKADQLTLKANLIVAERQYASVVGEPAPKNGFKLADTPKSIKLDSLDQILAKVDATNPQVLSARANEKINKLDAAKAAGALAPTFYATSTKTEYGGTTSNYNGVAVTIPIEIGGFMGAYGAYAKSSQAMQQRIDTEEKSKVEAERLYQLVMAGQESVKIKKSAVESAQLSVEANQKSFQAGVRSTTDVLNSIQVLFQAKNDYVTTMAQQSENALNLLLIGSGSPSQGLKEAQIFLFAR